MADPHDLLSRATAWKDNTAELDKIMADMGMLSRMWPTIVGLIAQTLILKTPNRLNDYQSAKCHVHAARAFTMDDDALFHNIEEASKHLANLREAWKPIAALGIPGEHPRVTALAAETEELKSERDNREPIEPPRYAQFAAPSLGQAQWLLDRARGSGTSPEETLAWRCVGNLGASNSYNDRPLWTKQAGPTAAGLMSDPTFKLLNLLSRSRLPDGQGVDSAKLWREVARCDEILQSRLSTGIAPVFGPEDDEELFLASSTSGGILGAAGDDVDGDA